MSVSPITENGAIIFMNTTSIDDKPRCAFLVAEDEQSRQANATIQLGGRRLINCTNAIPPNSTLFQHVLGGAHNLPFDYNKARDEFLSNSVAQHPTPPSYTTTELPGDEWTPMQYDDYSTSNMGPQSTLPTIAPSTTAESLIQPDVTLTSIQSTQTTIASISPDPQTDSDVQVSDILGSLMTTLEPTTQMSNESDSLVDLITMNPLTTTSQNVSHFKQVKSIVI